MENTMIFRRSLALWAAAGLVALFAAGRVDAQSAAWFGGGSYDGYDSLSVRQPYGVPYASNAGGVSNVTPVSAWLNGWLTTTGSAPTEVSVYWGPSDGETNLTAWARTNAFGFRLEGEPLSVQASGLDSHTTYYFRFFATNTAGQYAWAIESASFMTTEQPAIVNGGASATGAFSAVLSGTLSAGITAAVTLVWGPDSEAWSGTNDAGVIPEGSFTRAVSGLSPGSAYFCRFFASNETGTAWSEMVGFSTIDVSSPAVTASGASAVDADSAVLNGTLTAGGASVVVYWGTDVDAWSATNALGNREAGPFALTAAGLSAATPYAYRCYASNEAGEAWSAIAGFETLPPVSRFRGGDYDGFDALTLDAVMRMSGGVLLIIR